MSSRLEGMVIVVTGASSGMGRATALKMAQEGARVVAAARRERECRELVDEIDAAGGEAIAVKADVAVEADVKAMVGTALERFGGLDAAFNNAGRMGGPPEPWTEVGEEVFDQFIDPNLRGVWLCMKHELKAMSGRGGSIVNNSSIGGVRGGPEASHMYAASKHGVIGLTRNAALNYGRAGIRVNAVCPGTIANRVWLDRFASFPDLEERVKERIPLGRLGTEEEVADVVVWLCSDESSYVTGTAIIVDGGLSENILPSGTVVLTPGAANRP